MTSTSAEKNHYQTLAVSETATQQEIKQAYRRLAKQFHPDSQTAYSGHEGITRINAAYEVLSDPQLRSQYDRQQRLQQAGFGSEAQIYDRAERTVRTQEHYRQRRNASKAADDAIHVWIRQVYTPVDRLIAKVLSPLKTQIRALSADPFDDELMEAFQTYLEGCRESLEKARGRFQAMPNPANAAAVAANLYYCLNQLEDGIEEMERYTYCYEESYLHTGQELFRISAQLRREAKSQLKATV
ncbi:MAG: DnaJ domain-containing protein [Leptolyngbya sp. SIO1E4]|nr:DnaJ domain-containing protein [Leptolyngbya sp. SIO1E4]